MTTTALHRSIDPEVTAIEFAATGRGVATRASYDQSYVSVVCTQDGRIARHRDCWNPLVAIAATGGVKALASGRSPWACAASSP